MKIFSLDTSFSSFNFSVVEDGKVSFLYYLDSSRKTLENLPALIEEAGVNLKEFDAFAVSVGVGYLTSLRIGIIFMKTTAYLLKRPIVAYENLFLLEEFTPVSDPLPYLKVSNNIFYRKAGEVRLYKGEKLSGTLITVSSSHVSELGRDQVIHPFFPFSAYGGLFAQSVLKTRPDGDDPFTLEPLYIKPPL